MEPQGFVKISIGKQKEKNSKLSEAPSSPNPLCLLWFFVNCMEACECLVF